MKIKYKKAIVAYVDVLGFSNLIYNDNLNNVESYYNYVVSDFRIHLKANFKFTLISDSIVIYADYSEKNFIDLCKVLAIVQSKLLLIKILIRGAISFGNLYTNKRHNIIVGDGLIKAYKLESEAVFPRIIIDREFIRNFSTGTKDFLTKDVSYLSIDKGDAYDGYFWIDYIKYLVKTTTLFRGKRDDLVYNFIKEHYYFNIHYSKYKWLINKLIFWLENQVEYHNSKDGFNKNSRRKRKHSHELVHKFRQL